MGRLKNKSLKKKIVTASVLFATVLGTTFFGKSFAQEVIKSVADHTGDYPLPRYITYEQYINDPFLLCTGHGIALPGYGSTWVISGDNKTHVTDQGKDTGYLTANDLGNATCFADGTYKGLVPTESKTYGYFTEKNVYDATPAEAYVLSELNDNLPGNGVTFQETDEEYTGTVDEGAYLDVNGTRYYMVDYKDSNNITDIEANYVVKRGDKYYIVNATNDGGQGNYSAVQVAWWEVGTKQEGSRSGGNSLSDEAFAFEEYIKSLNDGKVEIVQGEEEESDSIETLKMDHAELELVVGKSETLTYVATPSNVRKQAITWTTSDKTIATVDANGKVTGKKRGKVLITLALKDKPEVKTTCTLTVKNSSSGNPTNEKQILLDRGTVKLKVGEKITINVSPTPSTLVCAAKMSDNKIAKITDSSEEKVGGNTVKIKALKAGTTTLTVYSKDDSSVKATCTVKVVDETSSSKKEILLDRSELVIKKGDKGTINISVSPSNLSYSSTINNKNIACFTDGSEKVSKGNKLIIKGVETGTTTVKVVSDKDSSISKTCTIKVIGPNDKIGNISVHRIELNKTELTIVKGKTKTLTATVLPTDATNRKVSYSSSNTKVATVDNNGKIKAVKKGTATITVKAKDGSNKSSTCKVTVVEAGEDPDKVDVYRIELNKTFLEMKKGGTANLTAKVYPEDATNKAVTFSSSNTKVVTVNQNGRLSAVKKGKATITVKSKDNPNAKATCEVEVDTTTSDKISDKNPETVDGYYTGKVTSRNLFKVKYEPTQKSDDAKVLFDATTNKYKIGPFSTNYVRKIVKCGNRKAADFAGIVGSVLKGKFYENGEEIIKDISTEHYKIVYAHDHEKLIKEQGQDSEGNDIDADYIYPYSDEEFYIEVDYLEGLSAITDFTFNYHYWNGGGKYTVFHGTYLKIQWKVNKTYIVPGNSGGTSSSNSNGTQVASNLLNKEMSLQDNVEKTAALWVNTIPLRESIESSRVTINNGGSSGGASASAITSSNGSVSVTKETDTTIELKWTSSKKHSFLGVTLNSGSIEGQGTLQSKGTLNSPYEYYTITGITINKDHKKVVNEATVSLSTSQESIKFKVTYYATYNTATAVKLLEYLSPYIKTKTVIDGFDLQKESNTLINVRREGFLGTGANASKLEADFHEKPSGEIVGLQADSGILGGISGNTITIDKSPSSGTVTFIAKNISRQISYKIDIKVKKPYLENSSEFEIRNKKKSVLIYNLNGDYAATSQSGGLDTLKIMGLDTTVTAAGGPSDDPTTYIKIFSDSEERNAVFEGQTDNIAKDKVAKITVKLKDSNNQTVTIKMKYTGNLDQNVTPEPDNPAGGSGDDDTGVGGGDDDAPESGTPTSDNLTPSGATENKAQPQTTPGPGGSDDDKDDDDDPKPKEEETELETGAAYIIDTVVPGDFLADDDDIKELDLTTALAGMVWEDFENFAKGEDTKANGVYNAQEGDKKLSKIEVRIWRVVYEKTGDTYTECTDNEYKRTLADAYRKKTVDDKGSIKLEDKIKFDSDKIEDRLFTDDKGDYQVYLTIPSIEGLDSSKYKVSYDVEFIYDGQTYEVTEYLASTGKTKTDEKVQEFESTSATPSNAGADPSTIDYSKYANDSYAIESYTDRHTFDETFTQIKGDKEIQSDGTTVGKAEDASSNTKELDYTSEDQGFDPDPTGEADATNNGNDETRKASTLVTKNTDGYVKDEFKLAARTSTAGLLLPYEDRIHIEKMKEDFPLEYLDTQTEDTFTYYKPVTEYFSHINLGLVKRDTTDISVTKDLYKAAVTVNNDELTYKYSTLKDYENSKYADTLNMLLDMQNSGVSYELGLYASDFYYRSDVYAPATNAEVVKKSIYDEKKNSELRLFATYKFSVYNDSTTQDMSVNRLSDYFDSSFTPVTEEIKAKVNNADGISEEQVVAEPSYYRLYSLMASSDMETLPYYYNKAEDTSVSSLQRAKRGQEDSANMVTGDVTWQVDDSFTKELTPLDGTVEGGKYKKMYTDTFTSRDENGKYTTNELTLRPGEKIEVFVTFEIDSNGYEKATTEQNENSSYRGDLLGGKNNVVEVSNYTTFYTDSSLQKNNNVAYKSGEISGRVDKDSAPDNVNFAMTAVEENNGVKYTVLDKKWFEDDTDSAPVFRIFLRDPKDTPRTLDGVVWEDELNKDIDGTINSKTGDGKYQDSEKKVQGVTVSLVEKIKIKDKDSGNINEYEFVWPDNAFGTPNETKPEYTSVLMTNKDGEYKFSNFVAGDYVVRFEYGNTALTMKYNGQDYKNTAYQTGIKNPTEDKIIEKYTEKDEQGNEKEVHYEQMNNDQYVDGTGINNALTDQITLNNEWHDLTGLTEKLADERVSDARDYESRRLNTIENSRTISNRMAEILALADSDEATELITKVTDKMNSGSGMTYGKALDEVKAENENLKQFAESEEYKALIELYSMEANTAKLNIEVETAPKITYAKSKKSVNGTFTVTAGGKYEDIMNAIEEGKDDKKEYNVKYIDFGIERRPNTILQVDKYLEGIELTKQNEKIFSIKVNEDGTLNTDGAVEQDKILSIEESYGVQGFKYINIEEEYLKNTKVAIQYKIRATNKSEADYTSDT